MRKIVRENDVCIDVGAFIGTYTVPLARLVGPKGLVIAVEPLPANIEILVKNIKLNRLENVAIINKALYSKKTRLKLYYDEARANMSTIITRRKILHIKRFRGIIEVATATLDEVVLDHVPDKEVRLLKIDAEGAEVEILKGASHTLEHTHYVVVEVRNETFKTVKELLEHHRFKILDYPIRPFYEYNLIARKE